MAIEPLPPCQAACPVRTDAGAYARLIAAGRYEEAYEVICRTNPFPSVCGRVCNHRCEEACSRGKADAPVNIMGLKRFVADWVWEQRDNGLRQGHCF